MALSGTISKTFCSGLCEASMEWTASRSLLTGKAALTVKVYLDTSATYKISSISAYTNKSYISIMGKDHYFSTPAVSSKGKKLMGTVTIDDVDCGRTLTLMLSLYVNKMKAYDPPTQINLYAYTTSAVYVNCYDYINIDTIDRLATSAVSGTLTLGTENTLTVTPKHADLTHTVKYTCGSASGTLLDNVKTASKKFTLPIDLAQQNTAGTTLSVKFITTTNYNGTPIGSTAITKTYTIPSNIKPSCSFVVSDAKGLTSKYGAYVQGQSKFLIDVTPTIAQNSPIDKYVVTADGSTFDTATVTSDILKNSGTQTIKAKVIDKRGRASDEVSKTVTVLPYSAPAITMLNVKRCDYDGTENDQGEYLQITFNASVSSLNGKNSAKYMLNYQTTTGLDQNEVPLTDYNGQLSVTGGTYKFPADTSSAYFIELIVEDDFQESQPRVAGGSTALTLINWGASGRCIGFGCVATVEDAVEVAFKLFTSGGFINPIIPVGTDLDELTIPNFYAGSSAGDVYNAPSGIASGTSFTLEVLGAGKNGQVMQRITSCSVSTQPRVFIRHCVGGNWGNWYTVI